MTETILILAGVAIIGLCVLAMLLEEYRFRMKWQAIDAAEDEYRTQQFAEAGDESNDTKKMLDKVTQ